MWFTHTFTPSGPEKGIGQLTPTGQVRIFTTGFPAGTSSITKGPDGAVWFTTDNNRIGRITMSGHVTLIPIPRGTFGAAPASIATGTDGNLWVVYTKTAPILRIRPSGQVTELCRMTSIGAAEDIEAGPDGDIWIDRGSSLVRVDPRGNAYSYDHLGVAGRSVGLPFVGEDGRVWFERVTGEYKAPGLLPGEPAHYVGVAGLARFSATEPFRQVCRAPRPRPKKPKR
jgi:virginiamycin B lyase